MVFWRVIAEETGRQFRLQERVLSTGQERTLATFSLVSLNRPHEVWYAPDGAHVLYWRPDDGGHVLYAMSTN